MPRMGKTVKPIVRDLNAKGELAFRGPFLKEALGIESGDSAYVIPFPEDGILLVCRFNPAETETPMGRVRRFLGEEEATPGLAGGEA